MNDTGVTQETEFVLRRLSDAFPGVPAESSAACWWTVTIGVFALGVLFVGWMYARERRSLRWYVAAPLALLRIGVYALLAGAFLLPAEQTWERTEKTSRVLVLLDVSPSVTQVRDDRPSAGRPNPDTRLGKVLDFLTDDKTGFVRKLLANNPVHVYRFGTRLDADPAAITPADAAWTKAEWDAFARYDFKPWVLRDLSPAGREAVRKTAGWKGDEPGTAEWAVAWAGLPDAEAIPAELSEADRAALAAVREKGKTDADKRSKLDARIDAARAIAAGTNVPESVTAAVNREAANMVQGIIVFSDGRSNLGSEAGLNELRDRAGREKIPVFTVAVGEARENVSIAITDVQAPDRAPPDEPTKVVVEADGVGLERQEVDVVLGLFLPTKDPKGTPDHELTAKLTFQPGDPPHGQAEFVLDPDKLPEALTEDSKKAGKRRQLKQGGWNLVARVAREKRELFDKPEHLSPPRPVQVIDSPLRVLLWASGPTREYQTLRTLLAREVAEQRAELSVFLQNTGGAEGTIVQDVPPERCLTKFPTRYDQTGKVAADVPGDKYLNLNEYDLVVAFDPDWSELSAGQIEDLRTWVVEGGGGFVYVAGIMHTFQLARAADDGRLKPLLEMLPALPDDAIVLKTRPLSRTPRRLALRPNPDFDVLKLEETTTDDPTAGWERFFTGRERYTPDADQRKNLSPKRGFFSYYPVKATKPGAALAEYLDVDDKGDAQPKPYLITGQPGKGRAAFLGSGEAWWLRTVDPGFYERFWVRFARAMSAARRNVQSFRGQVLVNKEYSSGSMVRVQARLLAPNGRPYPPDAISPKFVVEQTDANGQPVKKHGPFPLAAKKGAAGFDGYYAAQVLADPKLFPPGAGKYKVVIDVPDSASDTISGEFSVRRSDPELDNPRPDFDALRRAAGTLEEVRPRIADPAVADKLRGSAADDRAAKLAFRLAETDKLELIPQCLRAESKNSRNRGAVRDLWDRGFVLPEAVAGRLGMTGPVEVSYLLLLAVTLLGVEWTVRKVCRLA
jgi:hypothetical protein